MIIAMHIGNVLPPQERPLYRQALSAFYASVQASTFRQTL